MQLPLVFPSDPASMPNEFSYLCYSCLVLTVAREHSPHLKQNRTEQLHKYCLIRYTYLCGLWQAIPQYKKFFCKTSHYRSHWTRLLHHLCQWFLVHQWLSLEFRSYYCKHLRQIKYHGGFYLAAECEVKMLKLCMLSITCLAEELEQCFWLSIKMIFLLISSSSCYLIVPIGEAIVLYHSTLCSRKSLLLWWGKKKKEGGFQLLSFVGISNYHFATVHLCVTCLCACRYSCLCKRIVLGTKKPLYSMFWGWFKDTYINRNTHSEKWDFGNKKFWVWTAINLSLPIHFSDT